MGCKKAKHPLYTCKMFQGLSRECKMGIVKDNKLCLNCLSSGHFLKECPSGQLCKKCHQPHHSLLRVDPKSEDSKASKAGSNSGDSSDVVTANVSQTVQHKQILLMTCKVQIYLARMDLSRSPEHCWTLRRRRRSSPNAWRNDLA